MGISERKAKEKEDIKALILTAARKLFVEQGIEQTTIRKIAQEIGYSVGTVYVYYQDKNDILHDLHSQGFRQLGAAMKVLFDVHDPMERVKALGRVYLRFAIENPDMYDLMFSRKAPMDYLDSVHASDWHEGAATFDLLKTTVEECLAHGHFKGHELEPLSFVIWSAVHGMASLHISQRLKGVKFQAPETVLLNGYTSLTLIFDRL